jgi:hypothetical protein
MATEHLGLPIPPDGTAAWGVAWRAARVILDTFSALNCCAVRPFDPDEMTGLATTLRYKVAPGVLEVDDGTLITVAGTDPNNPPSAPAAVVSEIDAITFIWLDAVGTITAGPALPTAGRYRPLARLTADTGRITRFDDLRFRLRLEGGP